MTDSGKRPEAELAAEARAIVDAHRLEMGLARTLNPLRPTIPHPLSDQYIAHMRKICDDLSRLADQVRPQIEPPVWRIPTNNDHESDGA
jgi:hypothetical protein